MVASWTNLNPSIGLRTSIGLLGHAAPKAGDNGFRGCLLLRTHKP